FGIFNAVIGLLIGAIFSLIAIVGIAAQQGGAIAGIVSGVGAILFFPIFYGIGGFIGGVISALIYNVCAGIVGGLKLEFE
ncbi:MAG: hypothetical protein AAGJ83_08880, partial [Planctomycetota bacterium]